MNKSLFVNIKRIVESAAGEAGLDVRMVAPDRLVLEGSGLRHELRLVHLMRPTPKEIEEAECDGCLLVLNQPNRAAREAAGRTNHVTLPQGGLRIALPGLVLIAPEHKLPRKVPTVRLRGASGLVVESLLLQPAKLWTMRELSQDAQVSLGLVQRVLDRLLREQLVSTSDSRGRTVSDAKALLKLWGQENNDLGQPFAKAYLYSPLDALKTICKVIPDICFGGALAANSYVSRLSTVPAPFKVWVPRASSSQGILQRIDGLEIVEEGANLEFYSVAGDHWRIHASEWEGALRVSSARSFVELYEAEGRLQELAQAVLDGFQ